MKTLWLLTLLCFSPLLASGSETAYAALRVVGSERGQPVLSRVLEVRGKEGIPQPQVWKILLDDPAARGGVRELEVSGGRIISERTPVRDYSGVSDEVVMDFQRLNLDSEGAFTVANQEAVRARVGFDRIDYLLSADETRRPVWTVRLVDASGSNVGSIFIAADSGEILRTAGLAETTSGGERDSGSRRSSGIHAFPEKVERHFRRAGGKLEEFFTGKRTIDRKYRNEE